MHGGGLGLRDEGEGCGGVEAADHQPLGHRGQRLVLSEALHAHATQGGCQVPGGGGRRGPTSRILGT